MYLSENQKNLSEACISKGCLKGIQENVFVPYNIAVQPFETTQQFYDNLGKVHKIWQKLIYLVSKDKQFISQTLSPSRNNDPWLNFLLTILQKSQTLNQKQKQLYALTHIRSDYFMDYNKTPKIIQYNLICVGFSYIWMKLYQSKLLTDFNNKDLYFQNYSCDKFIHQIAQHYRARQLKGIFAILISQSQIITILEQKYIEIKLMELGIKCKRIKLKDLMEKAVLNQNNDLYYQNILISFAYFRSGYLYKHFQQLGNIQKSLQMRIKLAKSNTTCIPNVQTQLINFKRMQVQLSKPQILRKYLSQQQSLILQTSLVQTFDLDNIRQQQYQRILNKLKNEKNGWILKPNKQGGQNNIYGQQVYKKLQTLNSQTRKNYIIQKWIQSPYYNNKIIYKGNKLIQTKCNYQISRFGMISVINGQFNNILTGNGIRSRAEGQVQGMVISGQDGIVSWKKINRQQRRILQQNKFNIQWEDYGK